MTNRYTKSLFYRLTSRWVITVFLWLGVSACSQKPFLQSTLDEYGQRIAYILEADWQVTAIAAADSMAPPKKAQPVTATRQIKLNEFYQLPDCGIKPIIAERNTTLGKLQAPSQRYLYDFRLYQALKDCLTRTSDEVQASLLPLLEQKQRDVQQNWLNLVNTSPEISVALWSRQAYFSAEEDHRFAIQSWKQLSQHSPESAESGKTVETRRLEDSLNNIANAKTPAKIKNDIRIFNQILPRLTDFIAIETAYLDCESHPGHKQKAQYLSNVFNLFFIQKIQPHVGKINAWYYQITPILAQLPLAESRGNWLAPEEHLTFLQQIKEHVTVWQNLFKRCEVAVRTS